MNSYPDLAREHMEKSISLLDQFNLLHINDSIPQIANYATIYLMTANLPQAKTHFKRTFKIYEKIWADEPENTLFFMSMNTIFTYFRICENFYK